MDYPRANCYTIWSSNINTTNIFQFLAIFAKNFAILPQKPDVPRFPEVYQSFCVSWPSYKLKIIVICFLQKIPTMVHKGLH